jgi:hypothetical protein
MENVVGVLPKALDIIFKVQRKRSNEKITQKKKIFNLQDALFFLFLLCGPLLLSNLITFLFLKKI